MRMQSRENLNIWNMGGSTTVVFSALEQGIFCNGKLEGHSTERICAMKTDPKKGILQE